MLSTIYFDNQLCRSAVKIHDKSANDPLFVNLHRVFAEKKIPEFALVLSLGMVIVYPLRPRYARPPLPKGEARDARTAHQMVYRSASLHLLEKL